MPKRKALKFVLGIIFAWFFISLVVFMIVLKRNYVPPILMYHSVTDNPSTTGMLTLSVGTFRSQIRFLKEHKYNVLPLEKLAELIIQKKKIPGRTVAITLDDGYKDNYLNAYPVLKEYNLPATIFIITGEVGRPQQDRLSWEEIKQMQSSGLISFGSHCLGPEPLVNLKTKEEIRQQIFESKRILEEKLGAPVNMFSYPEGLFNAKIKQMVIDAGYHLAVATNPGRKYPDDDVFLLKRLRISENAKNLFVFWFESSGYYTFLKEKKKK